MSPQKTSPCMIVKKNKIQYPSKVHKLLLLKLYNIFIQYL